MGTAGVGYYVWDYVGFKTAAAAASATALSLFAYEGTKSWLKWVNDTAGATKNHAVGLYGGIKSCFVDPKETTKKATKKAKQLTKTKPVQSPKPITTDDDSEGVSNSGTQVNEATGKHPKLAKDASATPGVASRSVDGDHEEVGTSPTRSNTSETANSPERNPTNPGSASSRPG